MRYLNLQRIKNYAAQNGFIAGVCDAAPLERGMYERTDFVPFISTDLDKRTRPERTAPGVKSIIVIGVPHPETIIPLKSIKSIKSTKSGEQYNSAVQHNKSVEHETCEINAYAELSSLGQQRDYHKRVKKIAQALAQHLRGLYPESRILKILVDSPGLDEGALAVKAGLGAYGRHRLVISREYGTRFNIGCILTDLEIEPNENEIIDDGFSLCTDCRRCTAACPTNALSGDSDKRYDVHRCTSYLTQKDALTPTEETLLGNQLYGCDLCQDACPHNPPRAKTYIDPTSWLSKTDDEFIREYDQTAILWRGAEILRRNARIAADNLSHSNPPMKIP